ncbi:transcriptional regulator [Desulfosporosinus acidiphilus SJ4]|uniref:Transcriptional regulator n=1 Tax=Desulfosporosinus acidiphilus (strain DSM 22704 / JCM 16185 / SJ4) TaxID=646529 RepID=I4D3B6_DESAJ|nr:TetR/AcrR family transcriptional regulator [Desulfosporosinus acidiphilus]AFM40290.1 transcriptional regulator [Desulfosporosinus acidiphilus SJ4]
MTNKKEVFHISAEIHERILKIAKDIIDTEGIKFLTISRIVSKCEISRRTFYESFTSKEDLINELKEITNRYEFPSNIRNELILKALVLFSQNGYINTDMETIATSVGIKRTSIYAYFESKEDLLENCILYELEKRMAFTKEIIEKYSNNPIHILREYIRYNCRYSNSPTSILTSLARSFALNNKRIEKAYNNFIDFRINKIVDLIEAGMSKGLFNNNLNSIKAAKVYVTMFNGLSQGPSIDLMSIEEQLFKMYYTFLMSS